MYESAPDQYPGARDQDPFTIIHPTAGPGLSILTTVYVSAYITFHHIHLGKRFEHPVAIVYSTLIADGSRRAAVNITAHVTFHPLKLPPIPEFLDHSTSWYFPPDPQEKVYFILYGMSNYSPINYSLLNDGSIAQASRERNQCTL
jgi:hypothetical protein